MSFHAGKIYSALAKAYEAIARIFQDGIAGEHSARRLIAETEAGRALWREVCHFPIQQCSKFDLDV